MFENQPRNLVELVGVSDIYKYSRGDRIREIAENADEVAGVSTLTPLVSALEDIGITEQAVEPYMSLAKRINGISNRLTLVSVDERSRMSMQRNYPLVQVCTTIEHISDTACQLNLDDSENLDFTSSEMSRSFVRNAHSLTDNGLMFYSGLLFLGYIHAKSHIAQRKRYDEHNGKFFLGMVFGTPRIDHDFPPEVVTDLKDLASHIGDERFAKNVARRYLNIEKHI
ncbi:MAG TPA: hypothetical protein VJB66_04205 [Candidatus Nanoarchaeia archaeon]|nr:hypothetical protein [Candidatus Nanoarchaeia archaeon]